MQVAREITLTVIFIVGCFVCAFGAARAAIWLDEHFPIIDQQAYHCAKCNPCKGEPL